MRRCHWCGDDPLYVAYHDEEWGRPQHDDRRLFEMLTLEGAQAGLSWITILRKRESYRRAYRGFDPARVARFGARDVARLMKDEGIVRNRLKIEASIGNARAFLAVKKEHGSFDRFVWSFDDAATLSKALSKRGFRFVGPTITYAFMQAIGMVDDHAAGCFLSKRKRS